MSGNQITLVVRRDGEILFRRNLEPGAFDIGRSEDCEICLEDIGVSRRHARLHVTEDRVFIEDLGSGNGCWFDGRQVKNQTLVDGDVIVIDPFSMALEVEEPSVTGLVTDELTDGVEDATQLVGLEEEISLSMPINQATARLEVLAGEGLPAGIDLDRDMTMGRSDQRDIVLLEPAASRLHAEVKQVEGAWHIVDSGSANGLYVNGQIATDQALQDGDIIRIGATEFRFVDLEGPLETGTLMMSPEELRGSMDEPPDDATGTEDFGAFMGDSPEKAAFPAPPPLVDPPLLDTAPAMPPPPAGSSPPLVAPPPLDASPSLNAPSPPAVPPEPVSSLPLAPELQPNLGPVPHSEYSFGGMEMQLDTSRGGTKKLKVRAAGEGLFGNWVRTLTVGLLVLVGVIFTFKTVGGILDNRPARGGGGGGTFLVDADPVRNAKAERLVREGVGLFRDKGLYFAAFVKFNGALELVPAREDAKRLQYMSCEFVAIDKLRSAVTSRAASDEERRAAKAEAIEVGNKALKRRRAGSALGKVRRALEMNPGDPELADLEAKLASLQRANVRDGKERNAKKLAEEMTKLVGQGKQERSRGNFDEAISRCQKAMEMDGDRTQTALFYEAENCVNTARADRRREALRYYKKGVNHIKSGRLVEARKEFRTALRKDKDYAAASTKLKDVQSRLKKRAREVYNNALVMEQSNNLELAIAYFQEVKDLVDDPNDKLFQKAGRKLQRLTGG
jgi:pSer/pThr/pTyr-binding forkhead associated (FHA) protein/tetratricopeptide (TPR) repeat protein